MADAMGREIEVELTTVHKISNLNVNHATVAEVSGSVKTFVECLTENTQIQPFKNDISLPNINGSDSLNNSQVSINETESVESPACETSQGSSKPTGGDINKCEVSMDHISEVQNIDSCIQQPELNTEANIEMTDNLLRYKVDY
jgi:hypothetical protein